MVTLLPEYRPQSWGEGRPGDTFGAACSLWTGPYPAWVSRTSPWLSAGGGGPRGPGPGGFLRPRTVAARWPRGHATEDRYDLFIGLGYRGTAEPTGFKRDPNLPRLGLLVFSTGHHLLLVLVASDRHGACSLGAGRRETLRHSSDVVGNAGYWSRTLTEGSQLCKECNYPSLGRSFFCWEEGMPFDHSGFEPSFDDVG